MARTDFQMTANPATNIDDIALVNGDWAFVTSDQQHVKDTISAFPGWWKQFPFDGVGISSYSKSRLNPQDLINKGIQELSKDGYTCRNPQAFIKNLTLYYEPDVAGI